MENENNMVPFRFEGQLVRVEMIEGEPWWVAKDVCEILGLADVSQSIERLDDDEKLMRSLYVSGQNRQTWLIGEPGVYNLTMRSNKPEARAFRRWITRIPLRLVITKFSM